MRRIPILLPLLLLLACGNRVDVEERLDPSHDLEGETDTSRSVTLRGEDALQRAERLAREGDYQAAVDAYRNLYRNASRSSTRALALYEWARVEGNLLNPDRDVDAAIARLELLLEEFPDAEVAFRAQEELRRLQTWQDQAGRPRG